MKPKADTDTKFDFWNDNKKALHFQLTIEELTTRFKTWLTHQDIKWLNNKNSERVIRYFITDKKGLSSVHDSAQFEDMYVPLRDALTEYEQQYPGKRE